MNCEFEYCIYNRNSNCIVDKPKINDLGMCDACIVVSIEKDFLEKKRSGNWQN